MFWEIDKGNHEADLMYISKYLLSFFAFAAGSSKGQFDKNDWLTFARPDGSFLYDLYEKDAKNGKDMRRAIGALFTMTQAERREIYEAVDHDMKFDVSRSGSFVFESIRLSKEAQKILKDFFEYFYKVALCSARFWLSRFGGQGFCRRDLAAAYFQGKNKAIGNVCPVCLQPLTNASRETDVEHYFPKAKVPCLALHPCNLYFSCTACNRTYKGKKSPFIKNNRDLQKLFLPYLDTVRDKVRIEFYDDDHKENDRLRFVPANPRETYIDEKIEVFDHLYELEERWSGLLNGYYDIQYERYRDRNLPDEHALRMEMERDAREAKRIAKKDPREYLKAEYLEWMSKNPNSEKAMVSSVEQEGRKACLR